MLITGASKGLGLAILKLLIKQPHLFVIATARESSLPLFEKEGILPSENIWIRPLDVLSKEERDLLINEADEKLGGVDVLINNAGYLLRAVVEHVGEVERFKQMDTNFRAPMALTRKVLPSMRDKHFGHIINISSVGGMMAMPTMAVYSASKFALEGASEALWYEVKPWNIRVSLIQPGFINSSSYMNVKMTRESQKSIEDKNDPYHVHYKSMLPFIERMMRLSTASPETVARVVLKTINSKYPALRVPATLDAHIFNLVRRLVPRRIYHFILYRFLPHIRRWGED